MGISFLRDNATEEIWKFTVNTTVLHEYNWTKQAIQRLQVKQYSLKISLT